MRTLMGKRPLTYGPLLVGGSMVAFLLLESTLLYPLTIWGARPDLVMVVVGSVALLRGWQEGLLWGLLGGLLEDAFTGSLLGANALAKSVTGFILGLAEGHVFKENPLLPAVALLAGTVLEEGLFFLAAGAFGEVKWTFIAALTRVILPTAVATTLVAPFIYHYLARLFQR